MNPFSLLIKPTSADCNLRCDYCFYLDRGQLYPHTSKHRMPDEVLERMVRSFMTTPQPQYSFGWQGGEPLLMGIDFFKRVTELQKKYGGAGATVSNGLQTNAILIDEEFAEHLARYNFLTGVSLDGPAEIHDRYRRFAGGGGSHSRVIRAIRTLHRHGAEYNILTLVSEANVEKPLEIYRYLRDQDFRYHQYIECVEFDNGGNLQPFAISGEQWGDFLCAVFDEWYRHDTRRISVRLFDSILSVMLGQPPTMCSMDRDCRQYFVVEHNGDIYPCDFFVRPHLRLGNIMSSGWDEFQNSQLYESFGARKRQWNKECGRCPHLRFCAGCCTKNRPGQGERPGSLSVLCSGWKQFYKHTLDRFQVLANRVRRESRAQPPPPIPERRKPTGKTGRNDPCPCRSGKKYKHCCGGAK